MRKTFTQKFNEEQKVEEQISKRWGYTIYESSVQVTKANLTIQKQLNLNRVINPLRMQVIKPFMSKQHQQLLKQMAESEHQKLMRKRAEQKNEVELDVIKMMNQRIKQYNYILDHKHLKDKNSETTKKVLKLKPKSEAQLIVQQINKKNNQLVKVEDIQKQFQLNKNITTLYRKYKQKMFKDKSESQQKIMADFVKINRNTNFRHKPISQQNRVINYSQCLSNLKLKLISNNEEVQSDKNKNLLNEQININEPYLNQQQIKKNNYFQTNQDNSHQILQLYKSKINKYNKYLQQKESKAFKKQQKSLSFRNQNQNNTFSQKISFEKEKPKLQLNQGLIYQLKQKRQTQQKYFSIFLQKRNRKFKKPWGNKILIKFDSKSQAKQMLQGSSTTISPTKTQYFSTTNQFSKSGLHKSDSLRSIPKNVSEEDRSILISMREQQKDPKLYETMCKNEKVNLFLKAKKNNNKITLQK